MQMNHGNISCVQFLPIQDHEQYVSKLRLETTRLLENKFDYMIRLYSIFSGLACQGCQQYYRSHFMSGKHVCVLAMRQLTIPAKMQKNSCL